MSSVYPSWRELVEKGRLFDKEVNDKLSSHNTGHSDKHQTVEIAFRSSLRFLPAPFDSIAESVYESVDGYEREKLGEVKNFLHIIVKRGENRYGELAFRLGKITSDVLNLKNDVAKKSTLLYIRDILVGKDDNVDQLIYRITRAQEELTGD